MRQALTVLGTLAALLVGTVIAASAETWGDYTMMLQRRAGHFVNRQSAQPCQQDPQSSSCNTWAWGPQSPSVSNVSYGNSAGWDFTEFYRVDFQNDWVINEGWIDFLPEGGSATYRIKALTEVVTYHEPTGDRVVTLDVADGFKRYTRWTILPYCLAYPPNTPCWSIDTTGEIHRDGVGKVSDFRHWQVFFSPQDVFNPSWIGGRAKSTASFS